MKAVSLTPGARSLRMSSAVLGGLVRVFSRRGSILCFHGLRGPSDQIDSPMHMTLRAFDHLMGLVRASASIVSLEELHTRWEEGRPTRGLVAVTFDDAYVSLLETAHHWFCPEPFPITIFVVPGASCIGAPYWWDRVEALAGVLRPSEMIKLEVACGMSNNTQYGTDTADVSFKRLREWILNQHCGRAPEALGVELSQLEAKYGRKTRQRSMRVDELRRMAALGPVSFGVHTLSHPVLPTLPAEEALREVRGAWEALRKWEVGAVVPFLAAPYGVVSDPLVRLATSRGGMKACLALDDCNLGSLGNRSTVARVSRHSLGQRVTPLRLAYRLTGLREIVRRGGTDDLVADQGGRDAT